MHAAAGGAGQLITQVARRVGATVYGTVGSAAKADLARDAGAHETIDYTQQDFEAEVKRLTGGRGVDVVYDSVGKDTFDKSLNCLQPRGYLVLFGFSSGPVPPFDPAVLGAKGSLFLTRPGLNQYIATRYELWSAPATFSNGSSRASSKPAHRSRAAARGSSDGASRARSSPDFGEAAADAVRQECCRGSGRSSGGGGTGEQDHRHVDSGRVSPHDGFVAQTLDIYFIDVEGGQSTLVVTPAGESLLIDTGYAGNNGARSKADSRGCAAMPAYSRSITSSSRIFTATIDGGAPELSRLIPIEAFVDYARSSRPLTRA